MGYISEVTIDNASHKVEPILYGSCSTAAGTAEKTISLNNFVLETGVEVTVKFVNTNTADSPTLKVGTSSAKAIYYRGNAIDKNKLIANRIYTFVYDGTHWELIGDLDTNSNTTYTFADGTNGFTVTPSGGTAQTVQVTPSITITANATDGYWDLTGTNGTNAVTYKLEPYSSKQSGASFYTGTTAPDGTTRLNYNGYFYATKLYSGGNEVLTAHRTYTAFTGKPTENQTPGFGSTFTIQQISQSTTGQVSGTDRTVTIPSTIATNSAVGLVKPWYSHTADSTGPTTGTDATAVTVNAITTTASRYYAIEEDKSGRLFVNVPWTDHYAWGDITNKPTTLGGYGITDAKIASGVITLGSNTITPVTSVNGHTGSSVSVTASDLGLANALHFIGTTSTQLTDGATTSTLTAASTNSLSKTTGFVAGDVVIYSDYEFVWLGSAWEKLGDDSSFKVKQTAITDSTGTSESTTATRFVYSVSQDAQGVISVKTRPLPTYNNYSHPTGDGNLHVPATGTSNDGKFLKAGSTEGSLSWATLSSSDIPNLSWNKITSDKPTTLSGYGITDAAESSHTHTLKIGYKSLSVGTSEQTWTVRDILYANTILAETSSWDIVNAGVYSVASAHAFSGTNNPGTNQNAPYTYGHMIITRAADSYGIGQFYIAHTASDSNGTGGGIRYRSGWNGNNGWRAWATILDDHNYNLYAPKKDGTGASGSWGISVTGTASNVTGTVAIANGGTGATDAATARTNLGVAASSHKHPVSDLTWGGGVNLVTSATANNQEWSIDLTPGSYTGTYWHVWSGVTNKTGTILACYPDDKHITMPGNIASTSTSTGTLQVTGGIGATGQITALRLAANGSNTSYSLYVNGSSYLNGAVISKDYTHYNSNGVADASLVMGTRGVKPTATTTDGTTTYSGTVTGTAILTLGNNKVSSNSASGVDDNAQGVLRLYSSGSSYGEMTAYGSWAYPNTGLAIRENALGVMFRPGHSSYYTHISYQTSGNEALVAATTNAVTSFIFVNGEIQDNIASDRWTKLDGSGASGKGNAPGLQIKQNCISVGKLIPNGTNATYKLQTYGGQVLFNHNTASSTTNLSSQLIISNENGGNVAIELWRNANASWQIANEGGNLYIRNNWTTAKQTTYTQTAVTIAYNTGNATFAGSVTATGGFSGALTGNVTGNASTATCATRTGVSVSWHKGRDAVVAKTTTINSYSPTISVKTTNGSWEIGSYNHSDYTDKLIFSYVTDANYNSNTNSHVDFTITTEGYFSGSCASATKVAAKLATTTKTFLLGTSTTITATAANVDLIGDTGVYLTAVAGEISAVRHAYNVSGAEKAFTYYNSTDQSIDFVFA